MFGYVSKKVLSNFFQTICQWVLFNGQWLQLYNLYYYASLQQKRGRGGFKAILRRYKIAGLKSKIIYLNVFSLFFFKWFSFLMNDISFHINSFRFGWANVFATSAANTNIRIHTWYG